MSSPDGFDTRGLTLALRRSRLQSLLLLAVFGLALTAIWINHLLPLPLAVCLTLALCISCGFFAWRDVWRLPGDAIVGVNYGEQRWHLKLRGGDVLAASLAAVVFTGKRFLVLRFAVPGQGSRQVVLAADALSPDQFRRLRVIFSLGGIAPDQPNEGGVSIVSAAFGRRSG